MTKNWLESCHAVVIFDCDFPHSGLHWSAQLLQQFSAFPPALHTAPVVAGPHHSPRLRQLTFLSKRKQPTAGWPNLERLLMQYRKGTSVSHGGDSTRYQKSDELWMKKLFRENIVNHSEGKHKVSCVNQCQHPFDNAGQITDWSGDPYFISHNKRIRSDWIMPIEGEWNLINTSSQNTTD